MNLSRFNIVSRVLRWKTYVELNFRDAQASRDSLQTAVETLSQRSTDLEDEIRSVALTAKTLAMLFLGVPQHAIAAFSPDLCHCFSRQGSKIRLLAFKPGAIELERLRSSLSEEITTGVADGSIHSFEVSRVNPDGTHSAWTEAPWLLDTIKASPETYKLILRVIEQYPRGTSQNIQFPHHARLAAARNLGLLDFID